MDHVDHVANRVGIASAVGLVGGAAWATLKGMPRRSTALKVCASCTLVATAVFGTERLAFAAMDGRTVTNNDGNTTQEQQQQQQQQLRRRKRVVSLTSHSFGGVAGGGLLGYLYLKKPVRGMVVFVPTMLLVGYLELYWQNLKQQRWKELATEEEDRTEDVERNNEDKNNN